MTAGVALLLVGLVLAAPGCSQRWSWRARPQPAPRAHWTEAVFARKPFVSFTVPLGKDGAPRETVIGKRGTYRIRDGDTLLDVARYHDLGYNEIVEANPGVDPWIPKAGTTIVLPTEWVLPCCTWEGLVVNIPEMRLYQFSRKDAPPDMLVVRTFPVGLGRTDRRTPRGRFRVRGKTVNPRWNIPESIQREHIAERGDRRTFIAGGDPENPLGRHRFELTLPRYAIHGTNIPWGVGMLVSHGCVRLYPEDIERLFPLVVVGTQGELTYQQAKAGERAGTVYVEVHPDIYRYDGAPERAIARALKRRGLTARADRRRVERAPAASRGLPFPVSA